MLTTYTGRSAEHPLGTAVRDLIWSAYRETPRHRQRALGPSEIGDPCARKLAYRIMGEPVVNDGGDPLPSIVGTAAHTWMVAALLAANRRLGRIRWIPECEVSPIDGLTGHCDCYDVDTATVIDWKFPGPTKHQAYKREGPSMQYRAQAHLYGRGFRRLGVPVRDVAIVFFPRGGQLRDMHVWSEPFSPDVAESALTRYHGIIEACDMLEVERYPDRYRMVPKTSGHHCTFCPWFSRVDSGNGCPGYRS